MRVDSEVPWGVGQRVQSVVLEVRRAGPNGPLRSSQSTAVGTGAGRRPLPLFVGVSETNGDTDTPLWIEALGCAQSSGCTRESAVSVQRALVRFVPEQTVELTMLLSAACVASRCALDQRCSTSGDCLAASSAQATLRPIAAVPTDAASAADASTDATTTDGTTTDAATDSSVQTDRAPAIDVTSVDRPAIDDVPADTAPSDVPVDVRPMDAGPMDAGSMDIGADAPPDTGPIDAGPRDTGPVDTGLIDTGLVDTGPRDTGPVDTGPPLRCPSGMLAVPAGQFLMGSNTFSFEQPVHGVRLSAFCIDETEVTVAAYRACVGAGICPFPTGGTGCNYPMTGRDNHPINCVNWNQAQTYCIWRGGSLPTESQWEYVARGPESRVYPWGTEAPNSTLVCANPEGPVGTSTCPVATHRTGDSPFGAADMAGNVWEWMLEDYAGYTGSSTTFVTDPVGTMVGPNRTIRGGAYNGGGPTDFRGSYRSLYGPNDSRNVLGFRCEHGPL